MDAWLEWPYASIRRVMLRSLHSERLPWLLPGLLVGMLLGQPIARSAQIRLLDLDDRSVDPLQPEPGTKATVFVFISTECPISNRYAPEVRRLSESFGSRGIRFQLIYPNRSDAPPMIRDHLRSFTYSMRALRDPDHALARFVHATVTPEAVVFTGGRVVYRGRIDDRYVEVGLERPEPTLHDLDNALTAVLAGRPVRRPVTEAIGCFIADSLQ
jgi:hypothetical protein